MVARQDTLKRRYDNARALTGWLLAATAAAVALAATGALAMARAQALLPPLPYPLTNNAVAAITREDGTHLVSLMGLRKGKTWRDTTLEVWHLQPGADAWRRLPHVPGAAGRLAGVAVGVGDSVYVFGGYTVAEDDTEVSVPAVHQLDPVTGTYVERAPMPVPVDDTVAVVYRDRYIYLISGWHDTGNVNLVQRYDVETDSWRQATPWPGRALFGHAGGIAGRTIVACDGVGIEPTRARRRFVAVAACYRGEIDADDPARIDWTTMPHHPGPALYRMAAAGTDIDSTQAIVFAGGSANPYNYDGIGYNGKASPPSASVFAWIVDAQRWRRLGRLPVATMDHRGLLLYGQKLVIVGGMHGPQQVSSNVVVFGLGPGGAGGRILLDSGATPLR